MKGACSDRKPKSTSILDILKKLTILYLYYSINGTRCSKFKHFPVSLSSPLSWHTVFLQNIQFHEARNYLYYTCACNDFLLFFQ